MNATLTFLTALVLNLSATSHGEDAARDRPVLVEAEAFADRGGWVVDSQFMDLMGSPYLLAHGLGRPVADATTEIEFPVAGTYRVWVRTKDWVAKWQAPGTPGRFHVLVNGRPLTTTFGTVGAEWHWQDGGSVEVPAGKAGIALHDLTGFEGRCDTILFTRDSGLVPPNADPAMAEFRRQHLGLPAQPEAAGEFDFVVTGGGIAGTCAAVSAARLGLKVALVQDRPVLGGNNSSEVRVWLQGARNDEPWPRIGDVVAELEQDQRAHYGPSNTKELYEDGKKLAVVRAEKIITRPFWIPYRCLYSRNLANLFMAGRNISVTHDALGAVRVMRTCATMGEVIGMSASLCAKHNTAPRAISGYHQGGAVVAPVRSFMFQWTTAPRGMTFPMPWAPPTRTRIGPPASIRSKPPASVYPSPPPRTTSPAFGRWNSTPRQHHHSSEQTRNIQLRHPSDGTVGRVARR